MPTALYTQGATQIFANVMPIEVEASAKIYKTCRLVRRVFRQVRNDPIKRNTA